MKQIICLLSICIALTSLTIDSNASIITFDDAISGATTYQFDSDADGIKDVIFSTSDPNGFNTIGPGTNMSYISEPGLEGSSLLSTDLRIDFLNMAKDSLKFGFALDSGSENSSTWTSFFVYDAGGSLLASRTAAGLYTYPGGGAIQSNFPENEIYVTFSGVARYALFDFSSDYGRYIIDNFEGSYGSTEVPINPPVPEPSTFILLGAGLAGLAFTRKRFKNNR